MFKLCLFFFVFLNCLSDIDRPINFECPLESSSSRHSAARLLKSLDDACTDILINESHTVAPGRWLPSIALFVSAVIILKCLLSHTQTHAVGHRHALMHTSTHTRLRAKAFPQQKL